MVDDLVDIMKSCLVINIDLYVIYVDLSRSQDAPGLKSYFVCNAFLHNFNAFIKSQFIMKRLKHI